MPTVEVVAFLRETGQRGFGSRLVVGWIAVTVHLAAFHKVAEPVGILRGAVGNHKLANTTDIVNIAMHVSPFHCATLLVVMHFLRNLYFLEVFMSPANQLHVGNITARAGHSHVNISVKTARESIPIVLKGTYLQSLVMRIDNAKGHIAAQRECHCRESTSR